VTAWSDTVGTCRVYAATQIVGSIERIVDVSRNSPGIGNRHLPRMNVVFALVAQTVEDGSPRHVQRLPYHIMPVEGDFPVPEMALVEAIVVFEIVHVP
jgi:hypothetical protein